VVARVRVTVTGPPCPEGQPGTKEWARNSVKWCRENLTDVRKSAIPALQWLNGLYELHAWEVYFDDEPKTWERFAREALGQEPTFLEHLMTGGRVLFGNHLPSEGGPSIHATASVGAQQMAQDEGVEGFAKHGTNQHSGPKSGGSDRTSTKRGENAEYLVRRLKRDYPEIAQALARGEYKSARAAAIAAGIIRIPTAGEQLRRCWMKCSGVERADFLAWVNRQEANGGQAAS
jgi:hypothetical protein